MSHEFEQAMKRMLAHDGVEGILIVNSDGIPIRSTFDNGLSVQYAGLISDMTMKTKSVLKEFDTGNTLKFLRLRTIKNEIIVAPDKEFTVIVVQKADVYGALEATPSTTKPP